MSFKDFPVRKDFDELIGKTLIKIEKFADSLQFITSDNDWYAIFNMELSSAEIEDVCGDLGDLLSTPILVSERVDEKIEYDGDTETQWSFLKFSTIKGSVTIRFYEESSPYYSASMELYRMKRIKDNKVIDHTKLLNNVISLN